MVKQAIWTERKFEAVKPVNLLPDIIERLAGTPARLEEKVKNLFKEILTKKDEDGWSIQEHAGHLADLEELWENRLDDFASGKEILTAADMSNKKTYEMNHNKHSIEEVLASFRRKRESIVSRFSALTEEEAAKTLLHPRLKTPMNLPGGAYFIAEHDDHHLAKITSLINKFKS